MKAGSIDELLYSEVRAFLVKKVKKLVGQNNYEEVFLVWLLDGQIEGLDRAKVIQQTLERSRNSQDYKELAALGFVSTLTELDTQHSEFLQAGLERLAGREPVMDGLPASFTTDVLALLGLTLGTVVLKMPELTKKVTEWLNKFIFSPHQSRGIEDWQKALLVAVQTKIGLTVLPDISQSESIEIWVALRSLGMLPAVSSDQAEADETAALLLLKRADQSISPVRAALQLKAFDWISRDRPTVNLERATIKQVVKLLERVSASFQRWPWETNGRTHGSEARRWHIDNEYHVQSLLYAILIPIFPDLEDEFYTPSVGQKRPRADLGIPSLKLIIEVKYMRPGDSPQKMIDQIATDNTLYLVEGSTYSTIVAFIWDASGRSEHYDAMRQGIQKMSGVVGAVIIPRPGLMVEQADQTAQS